VKLGVFVDERTARSKVSSARGLPDASQLSGRMAKADAKPKTKKLSKTEQFERFRQTARKLGADPSMEAFERAFAKIVPPRRATPRAESKDDS
jgi:hypothetical protein